MRAKLKENFEFEEFSILFLDEEYFEIELGNTEEEVLILVKIKHPLLTEMISDQYLTVVSTLGQDLDVKLDVNVGIKNGFEEFLNKSLKFQKWLFCGFVFEMHATMNKDLMQKVFKTLLLMLKDSYDFKYGEGKQVFKQQMIFPLLLKSSKIHLTFKDIEDVDNLFRGLGLEELVEDQPTGCDLLDETFTEYEKQ